VIDVTANLQSPSRSAAKLNFSVGGDEAGRFRFGFIVGVALCENGRVFVLDAIESRVSIFDSTGTWIRDFGRKGNGPGEFGRLHSDIWKASSGITISHDTVFVVDHRLNAFDTTGAFLYSTAADRPFYDVNGIVASPDGLVMDRNAFARVGVSKHVFEYFDEATGKPTAGPSYVEEHFVSSVNPSNMGPPYPLASLPFAIRSNGWVYFTVGDSFHIDAVDRHGILRARYVARVHKTPISRHDIDDALHSVRSALLNLPERAGPDFDSRFAKTENSLRNRPRAAFRSAIDNIIVSDAGMVLARRSDVGDHPFNRFASANVDWTLITGTGAKISIVSLPANFRPIVFRGCLLIGIATDEDGVQSVRSYQLEVAEACSVAPARMS
jgi:hypothetical protein